MLADDSPLRDYLRFGAHFRTWENTIDKGQQARVERDNFIKELRAAYGFTYAKIADLADITTQRVHQICNR